MYVWSEGPDAQSWYHCSFIRELGIAYDIMTIKYRRTAFRRLVRLGAQERSRTMSWARNSVPPRSGPFLPLGTTFTMNVKHSEKTCLDA